MYLYRQTISNPTREAVQVFNDFDAAYRAAIHFVGEHNPIDGCSSPRRQFTDRLHQGYFRTSRSSSFGTRTASVQPIRTDVPTDLF